MEPAQLCGANYVPYLIFTMTVQTAGNFIQNEDLRASDQSSSDGDALPLALGQQTVGLPQHCQHYKIISSYSDFTHKEKKSHFVSVSNLCRILAHLQALISNNQPWSD